MATAHLVKQAHGRVYLAKDLADLAESAVFGDSCKAYRIAGSKCKLYVSTSKNRKRCCKEMQKQRSD